jgi:hypothetical protein
MQDERTVITNTVGTTAEMSERHHPGCIACGGEGLSLHFTCQPDGSVIGEFDCAAQYQGYPDRLHGGVVAMLLDAAMTHGLFARGIAGWTAKLSIRYHCAVVPGVPVVVHARLAGLDSPLYYLESEVVQCGHICAAAKGTFWDSACGETVCGASSEVVETSSTVLSPAVGATQRRPSCTRTGKHRR